MRWHALSVITNSEFKQQGRPDLPTVLKPESDRKSSRAGAWITERLQEHIGASFCEGIECWENIDSHVAISESGIQRDCVDIGAGTEPMSTNDDVQILNDLVVALRAVGVHTIELS